MPAVLLLGWYVVPAFGAEETAVWQTVTLEQAPREAPPPSVVLSTDELIKRHHLDVRTAIAVHDLLRAQEARKSSLRTEANAARRHEKTQAWLTETDDRLGTVLHGATLDEVRQRVQQKYRVEAYRGSQRVRGVSGVPAGPQRSSEPSSLQSR
jgi:hypothetical protein